MFPSSSDPSAALQLGRVGEAYRLAVFERLFNADEERLPVVYAYLRREYCAFPGHEAAELLIFRFSPLRIFLVSDAERHAEIIVYRGDARIFYRDKSIGFAENFHRSRL